MSRHTVSAVLAAALLALPVAAQDPADEAPAPPTPAGPQLLNPGVGKDAPGQLRENVFAPTDPIYVGALLQGAPGYVRVTAALRFADAEHGDRQFAQLDCMQREGVCLFKVSPSQPWPAAQYEAVLQINDQVVHKLPYRVVEPEAPTAETAHIAAAWMAKDDDGLRPTQTFLPSAVFHCLALLADAPADTTVTATWSVVEVEGVPPGTQIGQPAEITTGSQEVRFHSSLPNPWPVGKYQVQLAINGAVVQTLAFEVQAGQPARITRARLARDPENTQPTGVFAPSDTFFCFVAYADTQPDTRAALAWLAVNAEGYEPNAVVRTTAVVGPRNLFRFTLSNANGWPAGQYKAVLYLDGKAIHELPFQVQAPAPEPPPEPAPEPSPSAPEEDAAVEPF